MIIAIPIIAAIHNTAQLRLIEEKIVLVFLNFLPESHIQICLVLVGQYTVFVVFDVVSFLGSVCIAGVFVAQSGNTAAFLEHWLLNYLRHSYRIARL